MDNVNAIKEKTDIIDLVNGYVPLKKAGKNYRAVCPFHSEKTPSFMVSPELQRYRCFGCGQSGDIFNFVMELEGVDFSEALKILADRAGITLTYDKSASSKKERSQKQKIIEMNTLTARFYAHLLLKHEFGKKAFEYLKDRGINQDSIEAFQLGYAPNSWDSLSSFLKSKGYTYEDIVVAGLGKHRKNDKTTYDMFRGRLMFPLFDHMERVIGFSGRALFDEQEPKYINTPETAIYHKERFLYGLHVAKTYIRQQNVALIAEGQLDMISPFQFGIQNIVASGGTALTLGQISLLKRYTDTIILIFDSDEAGVEAAMRGVEVIQQSDMNIKVVALPKKWKDPDEAVQDDLEGFKELVQEAIPLWDYFFAYATDKYDMSDIYEKKRASDFLLSKIRQIEDPVIRSEYVKKFSVLFDVDEPVVVDRLKSAPNKEPYRRNAGDDTILQIVTEGNELEDFSASEIYALSLLTELDTDKRIFYFDEIEEQYFSSEILRELFILLKKEVKKDENLDIKEFYDKLANSSSQSHSIFEQIYLLDIVSESTDTVSSTREGDLQNPESLESELATVLNRLKASFHTRKLREISKAMEKAEAASDKKKVKKLQGEAKQHTEDLAHLSSFE